MGGFDEALEGEVLNYVVDVLLGLSLFGCFVTVLTFILFPDMRTYPIKLIIYLCLSIFFAQIFFFLTFSSTINESIICIPCAMILHYFFLADFIWTFCVAFNFYQMIVRRNRDSESFEKFYHLAAWTIPAGIVGAIAGTKNYWNRGGYCYMDSGFPIFLGFFLPGLIIVCANAVCFFLIAREIHDTLKSAPKADKQEKWKEVRVYASIFASIGLSWIFGFIMVFIDDEGAQLAFLVLYTVFTPLQGFLIFISYCVNAKVGYRWAQGLGTIIPFFQRFEPPVSGLTSTTASGTRGSQHSTTARSAASRNASRDSSTASLSASASSTSSSSRALL